MGYLSLNTWMSGWWSISRVRLSFGQIPQQAGDARIEVVRDHMPKHSIAHCGS
jgi:hypothetical protein